MMTPVLKLKQSDTEKFECGKCQIAFYDSLLVHLPRGHDVERRSAPPSTRDRLTAQTELAQ